LSTGMTVAILNASGCLDALTAPEVATSLDAFVTKTVTPLPREGNPPPRIVETDHWMLNSIGLQNPGIDVFCRDVLPRLRALGVPIWVSVGGFSASDYRLVCERLDEHDGVEVIELNLSCPNVEEAAETVSELVAASRLTTDKPLYAKLSPASWDIAELARAAAAAGDVSATAGARAGRSVRPSAQADCPRVRVRVRERRRSADRGHGRSHVGKGRSRPRGGRCEYRCARHGALRGPGGARPSTRRARFGGQVPGVPLGSRDSGNRARIDLAAGSVIRTGNIERPAKRHKH
jgi:Dihydroorotate dehydrogenase